MILFFPLQEVQYYNYYFTYTRAHNKLSPVSVTHIEWLWHSNETSDNMLYRPRLILSSLILSVSYRYIVRWKPAAEYTHAIQSTFTPIKTVGCITLSYLHVVQHQRRRHHKLTNFCFINDAHLIKKKNQNLQTITQVALYYKAEDIHVDS